MIIAFQGPCSGVGTTMVAQSVAEVLAKNNPGDRIMLLLFAPDRGRKFIKENFDYLDRIQFALNTPTTISTIYENCLMKGNLFICGGTARRYKLREYFPIMAKNLLEAASTEFDHIIVDAGNTMDFGLSMPAVLNIADKLYYVLSQNAAAVSDFCDAKTYFGKYDVMPTGYILNKYREEDVYTEKYIASKAGLDLPDIQILPFVDDVKGRKAELEQVTFAELKDKSWISAITSFAETATRKGIK